MTLFDPVTGKVADRDALRSVTFSGKGMKVPRSHVKDGNKVTELLHDDDGGAVGFTTEHASGRIDATVQPRPATASLRGD